MNTQDNSTPKIMDLYEFEYRVLPYLIDQCSNKQIHPLGLVDKESMIRFVESNWDKITWDWENYKSSIQKVNDDIVLLFWFPEPQMAPLARYAAAVVKQSGLSYYTLEFDEYDNKSSWYLCSQSLESHMNLGQVNECMTMEEFLALLQQRGIIKGGESPFSSVGSRIKELFSKGK